MKHAKSSQSLHAHSTHILKEQSTNFSTLNIWKTTLKTGFPPRKEFSSVYNARGRLNCLREMISSLQEQGRQAEIVNKDVKLTIEFLKEEYLQRKLQDLESELQGKVKQLKKKVIIAKRSDLLKYESIHNIFDSLSKNHKELQGKVAQIQDRVEQLENIMGVNETLIRGKLTR